MSITTCGSRTADTDVGDAGDGTHLVDQPWRVLPHRIDVELDGVADERHAAELTGTGELRIATHAPQDRARVFRRDGEISLGARSSVQSERTQRSISLRWFHANIMSAVRVNGLVM